ncbi:hypothetical protein Cob_v002273 [Colletotrichum orbiculare MAFF 240422]|uniref:Uncharacterized protein n=1 Tax=Colletotrichum orbiculare (strain 104-T / ATCC 96160 / CBS 514.97 / LARS 414 / MAFF 240422) TaxID=1213857 RepID=A0A484G4T9_COLOR|nr:hypothetical protein Cob_v002273 [Colletotrichum orbiculare MAFF 240422]
MSTVLRNYRVPTRIGPSDLGDVNTISTPLLQDNQSVASSRPSVHLPLPLPPATSPSAAHSQDLRLLYRLYTTTESQPSPGPGLASVLVRPAISHVSSTTGNRCKQRLSLPADAHVDRERRLRIAHAATATASWERVDTARGSTKAQIRTPQSLNLGAQLCSAFLLFPSSPTSSTGAV